MKLPFRKSKTVAVATPAKPPENNGFFRNVFSKMRFFEAGLTSRILNNIAINESPQQEVEGYVQIMRDRSREQRANNPLISHFVDQMVLNVVGPTGVMITPAVVGANGDLNPKINNVILAAWLDWTHQYATVNGISWLECQHLLASHLATDGELFIHLVRDNKRPHGFALELIDPDRVEILYNDGPNRNGEIIRNGIQFDKDGKPTFYYVLKYHPLEARLPQVRIPVPAEEMIHIFMRQRTGRIRGVPLTASVLTSAARLKDIFDATLIALVAQTSHYGILETTQGTVSDATALPGTAAPSNNNTNVDEMDMYAKAYPGVKLGSLAVTPYGTKLSGFAPTVPNATFDPLVKNSEKTMAAGLNMGYTTFAAASSDANYSSIRAEVIPERDWYRLITNLLIEKFYRPVYEMWLAQALKTGALKLSNSDPEKYNSAEFRGRNWFWVDPENELNALATEVALGTNSRTNICAQRGLNFREIMGQLYEEKKLADEYGINITPPQKLPAQEISKPPVPGPVKQ